MYGLDSKRGNGSCVILHIEVCCIWYIYQSPSFPTPIILSRFIVLWRRCSNLLNFSQSSSILQVTLVHKQDITKSISNRTRFDTYSSLYTVWWKHSLRSLSSCFELLIILNMIFLVTEITSFLIFYSNNAITLNHSNIQSFIDMPTVLLFFISISTPTKLCTFPLFTFVLPNFF